MCAHKNRTGRYASFCASVKDFLEFLEFDTISAIRRAAVVG